MPVPLDLTGRVVGHLTILRRSDKNKFGKTWWICQCSCGRTKTIVGSSLSSERTQTCGQCIIREDTGNRFRKHGKTGTRVYRLWKAMMTRCYNPNAINYHNYGGRGIRVCDRWMDFSNFYADMGEPAAGMTLDRIDNSTGYGPSNCRWATLLEQQNHRRNNRKLTLNGETRNVSEWARHLGMHATTIHVRLGKGWPLERVLRPTGRSTRAQNT